MKVTGRELMSLLVILAGILMLCESVHAQESGEVKDARDSGEVAVDEEVSAIDRDVVLEKISRLAKSGKYMYEEEQVEDPSWLLKLREWLRNLEERWENGPLHNRQGSYAIIGVMLVILLVIGAAFMLLTRGVVFGSSTRSGAEDGVAGKAYDDTGLWGVNGKHRAEELVSKGNIRDATSTLFVSSLQGLDNTGWIKYRKGVPSRAYLRRLRRSAELYPVFRDFLGRFEVAYYRKEVPEMSDYEYLRDRYDELQMVAGEVPAGKI